MSRDELWLHVNRALDERRDPLRDEHVLDGLLEHPELCDAIAELGLALQRSSRTSGPSTRRVAGIAAAAALLFGASLPLWIEPSAPRRDLAPPASVVHFEITLVTESPDERRVFSNVNGDVLRSVERKAENQFHTVVSHERTRP